MAGIPRDTVISSYVCYWHGHGPMWIQLNQLLQLMGSSKVQLRCLQSSLPAKLLLAAIALLLAQNAAGLDGSGRPYVWGPSPAPSEDLYLNGQITTSPFAFKPGTTLEANQQCLSISSADQNAPLVTLPCKNPYSSDLGSLLDKWAFIFQDQSIRPWGSPTATGGRPAAVCLDGGTLSPPAGGGNYADVQVCLHSAPHAVTDF